MIRILKLFFLCFCLLSSKVHSQQFRFICDLDTVRKAGFYKIIITPELSAHLTTDLRDIRIADEKHRFVPHITRSTLPYFRQQLFTELAIVKNDIADSGKSVIILENKKQEEISDLSLIIKNTAANRYASLSGSDNNIQWYIIHENLFLNKSFETKEDYYVQSVSFPLSKYRYFKLVINNGNSDPLNILKTGYYKMFDSDSTDPYAYNPLPHFEQKDSNDGRSYIRIINTEPYHVDKLTISISEPKYFSRIGKLYLPLNNSNATKFALPPLATINVISPFVPPIYIDRTKSKSFFIVIDNKDNPPLKVDQVYTAQLENQVIAYLEPGHKYTMM